MNITNTKSGQPYQLAKGTTIEVERTNLFFNEYGEQTVPFTLPDTPVNRRILGYPDRLSRRSKPDPEMEVTVSDDGYYAVARQVLLGATRKGGFETSLYMNEGSFLSRIKNTHLYDIFGDERVEGVTTVEEAFGFLEGLFDGHDDRFACFPVWVDDGNDRVEPSSRPDGQRGPYGTACTQMNVKNTRTHQLAARSGEYVRRNGVSFKVPLGSYCTPFIRANYLLRRVFAYFGYQLQENFFTRTEPFDKMVVLNNTCDTIVNGTIQLKDLIPNVTCDVLLEVFRKKFLCEFIPNETTHTVSILLMNELLGGRDVDDITIKVVGEMDVEYPERYKEIVLSSENAVEIPDEKRPSISAAQALRENPTAYLSPENGCIVVDGADYKAFDAQSGTGMVSRVYASSVAKVLAGAGAKYDAETGNEPYTVDIPDAVPEMYRGNPFVGKSRWFHSKLIDGIITDEAEEEEGAEPQADNTIESDTSLFIMLCLENKDGGSINEYAPEKVPAQGGRERASYETVQTRVFDYSLLYNGSRGIFERFYRLFDDILRNSFHRVRAKLMMSGGDKINANPHALMLLDGCVVMPDKIVFHIGADKEVAESEFYTVSPYDNQHASSQYALDKESHRYVWVANQSIDEITESEYNSMPLKVGDDETVTAAVFPDVAPKEAMVGNQYYKMVVGVASRVAGRGDAYSRVTLWMEVVENGAYIGDNPS